MMVPAEMLSIDPAVRFLGESMRSPEGKAKVKCHAWEVITSAIE